MMFTAIMRKEKSAEAKFSMFMSFHPIIAFLMAFVGMPFCVLLTLFICIGITVVPVAWMFGLL